MNTRRQFFKKLFGALSVAVLGAPVVAKAITEAGWSTRIPSGSVGIWFTGQGPDWLSMSNALVRQGAGRKLFSIANQAGFPVYGADGHPTACAWTALYYEADRQKFAYGDTGWMPRVDAKMVDCRWMFRRRPA